ncbi:unnamed protein product [Camellia sinensis]
MPRHKLLSKALSSKRETTSSELNPGSECSSGVSVPELHVFVRKKRVKKAVEVSENKLKAEPLDQDQLCGMPDIEDFAYGKTNRFSQLRTSITAADVPSMESKVAPEIRSKV